MIEVADIHKSSKGMRSSRGFISGGQGRTSRINRKKWLRQEYPLKTCGRIDQTRSGRVLIDGNDLGFLRGKKLEEMRSRLVSFSRMEPCLTPWRFLRTWPFPLEKKNQIQWSRNQKKGTSILDEVVWAGLRINIQHRSAVEWSGGPPLLDPWLRESEIMLLTNHHRAGPRHWPRDTQPHRFLSQTVWVYRNHCHPWDTKGIWDRSKGAMLHEGRILIVTPPQGILSSSDPVVHQFITGSIDGPIQYR